MMDSTQEWVEHFMVDADNKRLAAARIDSMIDPLTNAEKLARALLSIGQCFKGNDEKLMEAIDRLYEGYQERRKPFGAFDWGMR